LNNSNKSKFPGLRNLPRRGGFVGILFRCESGRRENPYFHNFIDMLIKYLHIDSGGLLKMVDNAIS
jgi:hypothetical protein